MDSVRPLNLPVILGTTLVGAIREVDACPGCGNVEMIPADTQKA